MHVTPAPGVRWQSRAYYYYIYRRHTLGLDSVVRDTTRQPCFSKVRFGEPRWQPRQHLERMQLCSGIVSPTIESHLSLFISLHCFQLMQSTDFTVNEVNEHGNIRTVERHRWTGYTLH